MSKTAKEKAKELVGNFNQLLRQTGMLSSGGFEKFQNTAKQCALICVDEILVNNFWKGKDSNNYITYWQSVRNEITNI